MELQEVLQKRRSIRKYTEEKVSTEDIDKLMHAAMSGPSACNYRPWEFFIIEDEKTLEQLRSSSRYTGIMAPVAIVVCGNTDRCLPEPNTTYWVQDCSAATENILLTATDLGLGTVWCGIYPQPDAVENVRKTLSLADNLIPLNIIYVGHPSQSAEARDQYNEEYIHRI